MNIRHKILVAFLLIGWLSGGAFSIVAINNASDSITEEIQTTLNILLQDKYDRVQQYIVTRQQNLISLSQLPSVGYIMANLINPPAQGATEFNDIRDQFEPTLITLQKQFHYTDLMLLNSSGEVLFSATQGHPIGSRIDPATNQNKALVKVFTNALNNKATLISPFQPEPEYDQHMSYAAAPVSLAGKRLGFVVIKFGSNDYYHLTSDYTGLRQSGEVILAKRAVSAVLIDDAQPGTAAIDDVLVIAPLRHQPDAALSLRLPLGGELSIALQQAVNGLQGAGITTDYRGQKVLAAWRYIPQLEWGLVVKINAQEAFASATQLKQQLIFTALVIGFFSTIFALLFANKLSAPLIRLVRATEKIAEGNFDQQIEITSTDEIGQLSESFNRMSQIRQQHEDKLKSTTDQAHRAMIKLADHKYALDQHAIISVTNANGTIIAVNDKFAEISGFTKEHLIGKNHQIINSGVHDAAFFKAMKNTVARGGVWHGEVCNKASDGRIFWLDTTIVPFKEKMGVAETHITLRTDITERILASQELKKVASFAIDNPDIVLRVSSSGEILFANPASKILLKNLKLDLGESIPASWEPHILTVLKTRKLIQFEIVDDDGTNLLSVAYGDEHSVNIYGSNISALKQAQFDATNAKYSAELALQVKGEFLASMSHEIRTPMNGVMGMLGLLLKTDLNSDQRRKAEIANSSAQSLLSLINDILDFSKVDAGKLDLEILDFDLHNLLGDFASAIAFKAQDKNLELILDIKGISHSLVKGDPSRIRQILTNLVDNATKFTAEGEIVVKARLIEIDRGYVFHCTVQDSGIGIPEDKIKHLFDAFTQVDASTTRNYGGTGLGLSIVKKLCELMDGNIQVTSEINEGSCFEFTIHLQKSANAQQICPHIEVTSTSVLIVDDNQTSREVLSGQLREWGVLTQLASSGEEALHIIERSLQNDNDLFDVAIIDMEMPNMNGIQLATTIKSNPKLDAMKLVIMPLMTNLGDPITFADLGFAAYFAKPVTTSDLLDALMLIADNASNSPLITHDYIAHIDEEQTDAYPEYNWPRDARLLLVEDNLINQEVARGILEDIGLLTDVVSDGQEALTTLANAPDDNTYTLLLMDCQMPVMDGYEATRSIRTGKAGDRYNNVPIIAMTANAMKGDREKCLTAGMDDYLAKPIDIDALETVVAKWLIKESNSPLSQ